MQSARVHHPIASYLNMHDDETAILLLFNSTHVLPVYR